MTLLVSPRLSVVTNNNNNNIQVRRRKSTGSYDGKGVRYIPQDKEYNKKGESDKDSLGDDEESFSDNDEHDSDADDALDGFDFRILASITKCIETKRNIDETLSEYCSTTSSNDKISDLSESDSEDDFRPELFGLAEDPGVLRFDCIDYPLAVIKHGDKDQGEATPPSRKVANDGNLENTCRERNSLHKSLDDISSKNTDKNLRCNCYLITKIRR